MKLEMRSASRVYGRPGGRPVSLTCRRDENIGNNVVQHRASTVMKFRAQDATAIFPLHYAYRVALELRVTTRTRRAKREWESQERDELCFHRSTAWFISKLSMFSQRGS